jgi:hypothetical protein
MAIVVGIDEAGFGPILGPLVVSSSVFSVPEHLIAVDFWQVLRNSVGKHKKALAGRLLVTDSKKAYNRRAGTKQLKRTVLAFLKCLGQNPVTLNELLTFLCPVFLERLGTYPWYKNSTAYKITSDEADVSIASGVLRDDMAANNIELLALNSCSLDVAHYNKIMTAVKNKSSVLFTATADLIQNAFDAFGDRQLQILIDRQGGRVHYRKILQRMFLGMELRILHESSTMSCYELQAGSWC